MHAAAAAAYAAAKAMCSESAMSSRKKIARARPTKAYCAGWIGRRLRISKAKNAPKVMPTKRKPYLRARSESE